MYVQWLSAETQFTLSLSLYFFVSVVCVCVCVLPLSLSLCVCVCVCPFPLGRTTILLVIGIHSINQCYAELEDGLNARQVVAATLHALELEGVQGQLGLKAQIIGTRAL